MGSVDIRGRGYLRVVRGRSVRRSVPRIGVNTMKTENFQQDSAGDGGLFIDGSTSVEEIKEFLKRRTENPVVIDDTTIWDFCGYERDPPALQEAVRHKLQGNKYIIPFQVTGTWGYMFHLLPEDLKEAEILVYDPRRGVYKGYKNFHQDMSVEQQESFRRDLAKRVSDTQVD